MALTPQVFDDLASLVTYPEGNTTQDLCRMVRTVKASLPEAEESLRSFLGFIEDQPIGKLEEIYTRTFDSNATQSLEVGWHIFGENYSRGAFLVHMRQQLRYLGLPESSELPDHLTHVLRVIGRLDAEEATELAIASAAPAIKTIVEALTSSESIYLGVLEAILKAVDSKIPEGVELAPTPLAPTRPPEFPESGPGYSEGSSPRNETDEAAEDCSDGCPLPGLFPGARR